MFVNCVPIHLNYTWQENLHVMPTWLIMPRISSNMKPRHFGAPLWSLSVDLFIKGELLVRAACLDSSPTNMLCSIARREDREVPRLHSISRVWRVRYWYKSRVTVPGNSGSDQNLISFIIQGIRITPLFIVFNIDIIWVQI